MIRQDTLGKASEAWKMLDSGKSINKVAIDLKLGERTIQRLATAKKYWSARKLDHEVATATGWNLASVSLVRSVWDQYESEHRSRFPRKDTVPDHSVQRTADRLIEQLRDRLWWPGWEDVPLDLYRGRGSRITFIRSRSREFRWRVELDDLRVSALVPSPTEDWSSEELARLGNETSEVSQSLCVAWQDTMADYLNVARGLRQEVQWRGGYDSSSRSAKEVRDLESILIAVRDQILGLLSGNTIDQGKHT